MNTLIVGMPRTRTSYIANIIASGGAKLLFEPFHKRKSTRRKYAALTDLHPYADEQDRYAWLLSQTSGDTVLKTLSPQHTITDSMRILNHWADVLILTQRNLLDVVCSFVIALKRNCWFEEDMNVEKMVLSKKSTNWIVENIKDQWVNERAQLTRLALTQGKQVIVIGEAVATKDIAALLQIHGIKVGPIENSPMNTQQSRSVKPRELIENIEEVAAWLDEITPKLFA